MKKIIVFLMLFAVFIVGVNADSVQVNGGELTLLSNTSQCLTNCEAWLEWDLMAAQTGFQVPAEQSESWKIEFVKRSFETNNLLDWGTEIWKKKNVSVTDYCWEMENYDFAKADLNSWETCADIGCSDKNPLQCECSRSVFGECGSHFEKQWQKDAENFFGYHFEKGDVYRIRLWGKKQAKIGENDVEWIPTFAGIEIPQWAWWNSNFTERYAINNLVIGAALEAGDEIHINDIDFSGLNIQFADLNDFIIVDANGGALAAADTELKRFTMGNSSSVDGNATFELVNPISADTHNGIFDIYTNNPAGYVPQTDVDFAGTDNFEDGTIDNWTAIATTGGTMAASNLGERFGDWSGRITTNGAGTSNPIHYGNGDIATDKATVWTWFRHTDVSGYFLFKVNSGAIEDLQGQYTIGIFSDSFRYGDHVEGDNTPADNTWYRFVIDFDHTQGGSEHADYYIYNADGTLLEEHLNISPIAGRTEDATHISLRGDDTTAGVKYIDWDFTSYLDSAEPPFASSWAIGSKESSNTAPEVAIWQLTRDDVNYSFGGLPFFSFDKNIGIDFNIFDADNDRLTVDINYNTTATRGGVPIVSDLNLAGVCSDQDWDDVPSLCKWDWFLDMADGNYYIIIEVSDGVASDYNISSSSVGVDGTDPLTVHNDFNNTWQGTDANIQFQCFDSVSGCKNFYYSVDDVNQQAVWPDANLSIILTQDGNHSVWYWSSNNADYNETHRLLYMAIDKTPPSIEYIYPIAGIDSNTALVTFLVKLDEVGKCYYGIFLNNSLDLNSSTDSNADFVCVINYFGFVEWGDFAFLITNQIEDSFDNNQFDVQKTGVITYVKPEGVVDPANIEDEEIESAGLYILYKAFGGLALIIVPGVGLLIVCLIFIFIFMKLK